MRIPLFLVGVPLGSLLVLSSLPMSTACIMPTSSTDSGTASLPPTGGDAASLVGAHGLGCGTDPTTGVTLCSATSDCPSVVVDPAVYPNCGFFLTGNSVYLACLCSNYLCPMGLPTSCASAAEILQSSNQGLVCGEASNGACQAIPGVGSTGPMDSGARQDTGTSSSGCDTTCEAMCAGEPDCIQACGC